MIGVYNELSQLGYNFKAEEIKANVFKRVNSSANLYIGINEEKDLEL